MKRNKSSIYLNLFALVMTAAMFVTATMAWFKDSATSGINTIKAGTLDVILNYYKNGTPEKLTEDTNLFKTDTLWEPGHMEYAVLNIENKGTQALQFNFDTAVYGAADGSTAESTYTNVMDQEVKVSDFLKFNAVEGNITEKADLLNGMTADPAAQSKENIKLLPNETKDITLAVYMPEAVENDANPKSAVLPSAYIGVVVDAAQVSHEEDAFDNLYDADEATILKKHDEDAAGAGNTVRYADGSYGKLAPRDLTSLTGKELVFLSDISMTNTGVPGTNASSASQTVLDLNGNTINNFHYELKDGGYTENSSYSVKNGTLIGTVSGDDFLEFNKSMKSVSFDSVTVKRDPAEAWDKYKSNNNYYGLNISAGVQNSTFSVTNSTIDVNTKFLNNASNASGTVTLAHSTFNGLVQNPALEMNCDDIIVNGKLEYRGNAFSNTSGSIKNSTVNGDLFISCPTKTQNTVVVENSVVNGNLTGQAGYMNVDITMKDVTVTGKLGISASNFTGKLHIISGQYGFNPTKYLVAGSTAVETANGMWIVTAE